MITHHRNNGQQFTTERRLNVHPWTEDSERRRRDHGSDSAPRRPGSGRLHWEMLLIWAFVVFSFAASFFCLWAISAKCNGDWPL